VPLREMIFTIKMKNQILNRNQGMLNKKLKEWITNFGRL
jgi:hypothetical protein